MEPRLQFMCGPLLRYDTNDEYGIWHGVALIVSECCSFSLGLRLKKSRIHTGEGYDAFYYLWSVAATEGYRKSTGRNAKQRLLAMQRKLLRVKLSLSSIKAA